MRLLGLGLATPLVLAAALADPVERGGAPAREGSVGCLHCHDGIEEMHPAAELSCVDCHGGDATTREKLLAHVAKPAARGSTDESVAKLTDDLAWRRFRNPMDLRIVDRTCGTCHSTDVEHLLASLHGTTAGHLSDGYYEMGLTPEKGSVYSVFPVHRAPLPGGEVDKLIQVPPFADHMSDGDLAKHYTDLARKECMQCHLWSEGRAVRGRVGFDGDYRGEGCAACHVEYALDGLSESTDPVVSKTEPGHPRAHSMTTAPTTATCTSCHYGDASIGLHFRGLSQLPPGAPGGPDIPGTTDVQLNRTFYLDDPELVPPDVHHAKGMHCVDCHTRSDVMGDGQLHGQMEHAVEISCEACHGTFERRSQLVTERGTPLEHLDWDGEHVILTSKVDGRHHVVPQAVHVLDPERPEYNASAAQAMTAKHAELECYTCHAGWNVNFLGFHFTRNESLSQLDLLTGRRTPGRVTTQEKVFATWKSFYVGRNERGAVAPYLTGFSTMGSVWDSDGQLVLDQVMPETAAGLSGMTMVHHQLHSTRPTARQCVECHRTSSTWGFGSPNFRLGRKLAFVAERRGIEVVAVDRTNLAASVPVAKLTLGGVVALALDCEPLQGDARWLYAAEEGSGVHVVDVADPAHPRHAAFVATVDPRALALAGDTLLVADGEGGLVLIDVSAPERPRRVGHVPTFEARGVTVSWPWAYVADGPGGLAIVDVRAPFEPRYVTAVDLNGESRLPNAGAEVATLFQYSRPRARRGEPIDRRTTARHTAVVLDEREGVCVVDVTEPTRPKLLFPLPRRGDRSRSRGRDDVRYKGLAMVSHVDVAEAQGGERTAERDYAYVLVEVTRDDGTRRSATSLVDVTDPTRIGRRRSRVEAGYGTEELDLASFYNPPFLQRYVLTPGELGVFVADVSTTKEPAQSGRLVGIGASSAVAVEEFPLDAMTTPEGRPLKDVSHPGSRWMYRAEVERILDVDSTELGLDGRYPKARSVLGTTARLHLERLDQDGTGFLEADEIERAGAGLDADDDGRVSLIELARPLGLLTLQPPVVAEGRTSSPVEPPPMPDTGPAPLVPREDSRLARILDGVRAFEHDADSSGGLSRREAARAVFDGLDLDDDGRLGSAELSRCPGPAREIRYGGPSAVAALREVSGARDGKVSRREFELPDVVWNFLDADRDGQVSLPVEPPELARQDGFVGQGAEWPARRGAWISLPPNLSTDAFLARFDRDGDALVEGDELRSRPGLLRALDRDGSGAADEAEIQRIADYVAQQGVGALPDAFELRWDLDGDGRVEPEELPGHARARVLEASPRR